jgi:hypothetical protein
MAKKTKSDDVVVFAADAAAGNQDDKNDTVSFFKSHALQAAVVADELGIDLDGSAAERVDLAAVHMSRSQRHMLVAGILLASIKSECEHGQFARLIESRGFQVRAAQRAMAYAQYIVQQSPDERERLIGMTPGKVLVLAGADPEVIEALAASGESIDTLNVRELQEKIRELACAVADRDVQLETAQAEAKAAKKAAGKKDRAADVPIAIFDIRSEATAQVEKSRLAIEEVQALGRDLFNLRGMEGVYQWVDPTARLALTGLVALQVQIDGVIKQLGEAFEVEGLKPVPMSYLTPVEVEEAAKRYADLTALHQHEKALRDWERQQERPRGKGRPAAKPEAPKTHAE